MPHPDHEQNRKMWNEIVEIHWNHPDYRLNDFLKGWSSLTTIDHQFLPDVRGKSLLHLMCQFGMDTLSWAREGAIVTGVDISDRSIELADKLKQIANIEATFIHSDVLELKGKINQQFDIIYQSRGTLSWLADLNGWASVVADHLQLGGKFLLIDSHPVSHLFLEDDYAYFQSEAIRYSNECDYCDRDYLIKEESIEHQHTMADILNALIAVDLKITALHEYDKLFYGYESDWVERDGYWYPPTGPTPYPLMFALTATK